MTETQIDTRLIVLSKGTRHVSIQVNAGSVVALAHSGSAHYSLAHCYARREFKSVAGARRWAVKQLG